MTKPQENLFVRSDTHVFTKIDDDYVLLDPETGDLFAIREVGAAIWAMLEYPTTVDSIVSNLIKSYNVSYEECFSETSSFLNTLKDNGMISCTSKIAAANQGNCL